MARRRPKPQAVRTPRSQEPSGTLRVIGGTLRGQPIRYLGDPRTRPMKQRVREAAFNLLGSLVEGAHVLDLFAGTGALTWEAISQARAQLPSWNDTFPSARLVQQNAQELGLASQVQVIAGDTFYWVRKLDLAALAPEAHRPWLVFCCPPYDLYVSQHDEMVQLIQTVQDHAPSGSYVLVESDDRFAVGDLPAELKWDVRAYPPAVLALAATGPPTP